MALDKQINMYSVDTGHFYSNKESYLHNLNCKYRQERNYLRNKLSDIKEKLLKFGCNEEDIQLFLKEGIVPDGADPELISSLLADLKKTTLLIEHKTKGADKTKQILLRLLKNKVDANLHIVELNAKDNGNRRLNYIRNLDETLLADKDVISVFESALSRILKIDQDEFTDNLMVVQVYYFDVFKDIFYNGFTFKGEKYCYYTSSAGQIRKKKAVFIKESAFRKYEKMLMCGLTVDSINAKGGNNVNKHLAYMALTNSATDEWLDFNIDKTIVIDDFETEVRGVYDLIDDEDYSIHRMDGSVPITHTDGAGMVLPSLLNKNAMFRAPWVKGLLGVFDFIKFIQENNYSPIIKDIYGKEHDVIEEDIQIILTKSQFKMYKYYDSWDEYKTYFKQYNCKAGLCNVEEDRIKSAKINYQMLQTLTSITPDEMELLASKSSKRITNLCNSEKTMKEALGITPYNNHMTAFQEAVKIYPALLNDTYAKDIIRSIKNSLLHKYRSGKLDINGKYTFLLPDYYAACEYWFGHIEEPNGLLKDQEVYCYLMRYYEKLDCLRSPHLYKEHAIRHNVASRGYGERAEKIREWFTTNALYTSSYDLVSKILQFDVDGDKALVVADPDFVRIAERNMIGIVPLYYNMRKADPVELNKDNIYHGLIAAFTGGNIGIYSNNISKIWNSEVFITGTEEEKQEAINTVKLLCMENNFCIDYAKTLYKPTRPSYINKQITKYTGKKVPAFFEFAKDKSKEQVESRNNSFVNKLFDIIPNKPINTRGLKLDNIDYRLLMGNVNIRCDNSVSNLYKKLNPQYRYMLNMKDEYIDNLRYVACEIRNQFTDLGYSIETVTDMLVHYCYTKNVRYKELLWFCFGRIIVENMKKNIQIPSTKLIQCIDCGEWIETVSWDMKTCRCEECQNNENKRIKREYKRRISQR